MKKILIAALALVAAAACGKADLPLENTKWKLVELNGEQNAAFGENADSFWFSLDGKQIFGTGACNRFFGGYELSENDGIEIGPMGMTKMYCPNIDLEDAFVRALDEADAYSVKGDVLTLSKEGKALVSFQGSAMPSQSDGASIDNEGADAATEPAQAGEPAAETGVSAEPAE